MVDVLHIENNAFCAPSIPLWNSRRLIRSLFDPGGFWDFFSHDKCQCIATILLLIYLYTRSGSLKVIENIYPTLSNKNPQQNVKATLQGSGTWVDGKVLVEVDDKRQVIMRTNS